MRTKPVVIDGREVDNDETAVVVYDNPLDNVNDLAHIFFTRCLEAEVVPYVVTKKTVFKWQEGFWQRMKAVFDEHYKEKYQKSGLLDGCGNELQHLISDAATMQIIRWTGGGFGMACHNYDGDMLTDEVAQVHRSPGFITSNLIGKRDDGVLIKEFEASHGTVADLYHMMLRGEETSMNPLGMVVALFSAMDHAASLDPSCDAAAVRKYTTHCREAVYAAFQSGKGTRDLCGPSGLTTEQFVETVAADMVKRMASGECASVYVPPPAEEIAFSRKNAKDFDTIDQDAMKKFFQKFDVDNSGEITFDEFVDMTIELGIAPLKTSAVKSKEKQKENKASIEAPF